MDGQARIVGGKLAIMVNGNLRPYGVRFFRNQIAQIEASKLAIKASTYVTLCHYRAAVSLWDSRTA